MVFLVSFPDEISDGRTLDGQHFPREVFLVGVPRGAKLEFKFLGQTHEDDWQDLGDSVVEVEHGVLNVHDPAAVTVGAQGFVKFLHHGLSVVRVDENSVHAFEYPHGDGVGVGQGVHLAFIGVTSNHDGVREVIQEKAAAGLWFRHVDDVGDSFAMTTVSSVFSGEVALDSRSPCGPMSTFSIP